MHFSVPLAALALAMPSLADFHIGRANKQTSPLAPTSGVMRWTDYVACPSNFFGCQCYGGFSPTTDRGVGTVRNAPATGDFSLNGGLCGMGQLNFYYRYDRNLWEFYQDGGDGTVQGECYSNIGSPDGCAVKTATLLTVIYSDLGPSEEGGAGYDTFGDKLFHEIGSGAGFTATFLAKFWLAEAKFHNETQGVKVLPTGYLLNVSYRKPSIVNS